MKAVLDQPLTLPCGAVIPNRIAKAAMTEGLADDMGRPTEALDRLYGLWADGGAGLLISGNVQIDRDHLERPGNVVIDAEPDAEMAAKLAWWAKTATRGGGHFWAQLSHGGRQTQRNVNPHPKAPSAVKVGLPGGQFGEPVALTIAEIDELVARFALAARVCRDAGFTGVQVHAAHGYLLSAFLSPRANVRTDDYGGSLENRARFLRRVVAAVRTAVGREFPVAVKLNSADFQRGGFNFDDSLRVAEWLQDDGIDLIELSGGSYEQPKLLGMAGLEDEAPQHVAPSTLAREAYFVDFAAAMQKQVRVPLMVTGGFRSLAAMEEAVASGAAAMVGVGRPMCVLTDAPRRLLDGSTPVLPRYETHLALLPHWLRWLRRFGMVRALDGFAVQYWYYAQLYKLGRSGHADPGLSVRAAWAEVERTHKRLMKARRAAAAP